MAPLEGLHELAGDAGSTAKLRHLLELVGKAGHGSWGHAPRIAQERFSMPKTESIIIDELYVVLGKDSDGNEGIAVGVDSATGQTEPLIGSRQRMGRILPLAQALADQSQKSLFLVKFSTRGNLQTINPSEDS